MLKLGFKLISDVKLLLQKFICDDIDTYIKYRYVLVIIGILVDTQIRKWKHTYRTKEWAQ